MVAITILVGSIIFFCAYWSQLRQAGCSDLTILNIGGGLGIDYQKGGQKMPSQKDFIEAINNQSGLESWHLFLEPGRSLIANAGGL
jgi:diaminopimelate decarboxylase